VSYTYLIIVAKFQINSKIFEVIKKSSMPRAYKNPPPNPGRVKQEAYRGLFYKIFKFLGSPS